MNKQKMLLAAALIDRDFAQVRGDSKGEAIADARVKETTSTLAAMREANEKGAATK